MSRRDRGGASLELVILAPFLLALLLLIVAFARFTQAKGLVDQAARDAARAATSQNSRSQADGVAAAAAADDLHDAPSSCRQSAATHMAMTPGAFTSLPQGATAIDPDHLESVSVTVSCQVDLGDLMILSLGERTVSFTFTSPLDKYRGYQP